MANRAENGDSAGDINELKIMVEAIMANSLALFSGSLLPVSWSKVAAINFKCLFKPASSSTDGAKLNAAA